MAPQKFSTALLSFFAASVLLYAPSVFAGSECYAINGKPAGGVYRCDNSTSGESSCCNAGQICMSNGVCVATDSSGKVRDWLRVGCTDPTWNDPACLKQCTSLVPGSSCGIRPCGGLFSSNQYCCDTTSNGPGSLACCSNPNNLFPVGVVTTVTVDGTTKTYPYAVATIPLKAAAPSSITLTSSSSTSSTTLSSSSSASTSTSSSSSSSSASFFFPATTSTSTVASTTSSTSSQQVTSTTSTAQTTSATSAKPAATISGNAVAKPEIGVRMSFGIALFGGLIFAL